MNKLPLSRRQFIKIAGISAAVIVTYPLVDHALQLVPKITFQEQLFRGTFDGLIERSKDNGQSWEKMMNFGGHIQVEGFRIVQERLIASLKLGHHSFLVESMDGRIWKTI